MIYASLFLLLVSVITILINIYNMTKSYISHDYLWVFVCFCTLVLSMMGFFVSVVFLLSKI